MSCRRARRAGTPPASPKRASSQAPAVSHRAARRISPAPLPHHDVLSTHVLHLACPCARSSRSWPVPMSAVGPFFRRVDTVTSAELDASGEDATLRTTPLLVKGATSGWPAARLWDFDYLSGVCGCACCGRCATRVHGSARFHRACDRCVTHPAAPRRTSHADASLLPATRRRSSTTAAPRSKAPRWRRSRCPLARTCHAWAGCPLRPRSSASCCRCRRLPRTAPSLR